MSIRKSPDSTGGTRKNPGPEGTAQNLPPSKPTNPEPHMQRLRRGPMCSSKSIHCPVRLMTQRAMEMKMMAGASVSHSSDADDDNAYEHRKSRAEMEVETDMDPEKHRQEFLARTGISTDTATFRMFIIFGTLAFTAILTIFTFDEFLLFFHTNNLVVKTRVMAYPKVPQCLVQTFLYPFLGKVSDRTGRRPFFILISFWYILMNLFILLLPFVGNPALKTACVIGREVVGYSVVGFVFTLGVGTIRDILSLSEHGGGKGRGGGISSFYAKLGLWLTFCGMAAAGLVLIVNDNILPNEYTAAKIGCSYGLNNGSWVNGSTLPGAAVATPYNSVNSTLSLEFNIPPGARYVKGAATCYYLPRSEAGMCCDVSLLPLLPECTDAKNFCSGTPHVTAPPFGSLLFFALLGVVIPIILSVYVFLFFPETLRSTQVESSFSQYLSDNWTNIARPWENLQCFATPLLRVLLLAGAIGIGSFNVFYFTVWTPFLQYRFGWTSTDIAASAILGFVGSAATVASIPTVVEHIGDYKGIIIPIPVLYIIYLACGMFFTRSEKLLFYVVHCTIYTSSSVLDGVAETVQNKFLPSDIQNTASGGRNGLYYLMKLVMQIVFTEVYAASQTMAYPLDALTLMVEAAIIVATGAYLVANIGLDAKADVDAKTQLDAFYASDYANSELYRQQGSGNHHQLKERKAQTAGQSEENL